MVLRLCVASGRGPRAARLPREGACGSAGRWYGVYGAVRARGSGNVVTRSGSGAIVLLSVFELECTKR
jgi:hypothetical protein